MSTFTNKQEMFIKEYLIDLNATQAAIRSGYSGKTASQQGERLLRNVKVSAAIQEAMNKRSNKLEITAERVLQEIARLAFYDPRNFFDDDGRIKPISELDDNTAMALGGIETLHKIIGDDKDGMAVITKIKLVDKGQNLERLGRHLKLFTDKVEHSGTLTLEQIVAGANEPSDS